MNNPISEPALVQEDVAASAPSKAKMACQISSLQVPLFPLQMVY